MNAKKKKEMIIGGSLAALAVVVLLGGYLLVISPKQSRAASLQREAADTQTKLTLALAEARHPTHGTSVDASDLFRLSKAMPDRVDTADAILDLVAVGKATGVSVDGLSTSDPTPSTDGGSYQLVPITATLGGRYLQLTNFLGRVRHLVAVRHGRIGARGRLFGVDSITLGPQADPTVKTLKATVVFETYVYSSAAAAPPVSTTPPAASSSDLSAAGATG